MKKYTLTEEHRAQLKPWADRWIANAMSTRPMTEEDRAVCRDAVRRLYMAANMKPPPDNRIVFVPSPFVVRFASGFAAWIWHCRDAATYAATDDATHDATHDATDDATHDATDDATHAATDDATHAATDDATYDATYAATRAATYAATCAATYAATRAATRAATLAATLAATDAATDAATRAATLAATLAATDAATDAATRAATLAATDDATGAATRAALSEWFFVNGDMRDCANTVGVGVGGLYCAQKSYSFWQGGNQWSAFDSFLSFFRHVAKLTLDYTSWDAWETLSLHSGPRAVHKEFCIISDRPSVLKVDSQNLPHCDDGPFCRWKDGSALYSIHGVRIPAFVVERPESITVTRIKAEGNEEVRRIMIERFGWERFLNESGAKIRHKRFNERDRQWEELRRLDDGTQRILLNDPSTGRRYALGCPSEIATCEEAQNWLSHGLDRFSNHRS